MIHALDAFFLMFREFEHPFYFRHFIHSIRYIITYNIFIIALTILIDKVVLVEFFFLIIYFTYIFLCFQGLLELVQADIEVKCFIIK